MPAITSGTAENEGCMMMRTIFTVSLSVVLGLVSFSLAECPSADLTGDYFVNLEDYAVLAGWWWEDCNSSNNYCEGADFG